MSETPKYSVIVPVYNSADTLKELIERINNTMRNYSSYEIICIDDFSTDNSWNNLITLKKDNEHLRLIKFTKNFGQAAATLCGIRKAKAKIMIVIDDDLQYPPEEIKKLIDHFNPKEKYILFGVPKIKQRSLFNKLISNGITLFLNKVILKTKNKIGFSTFKIFTKKNFDVESYNEQTLKSQQIFFKMVSPSLMDSIEVEHQKRKKGKSTYNLFKKITIALELILVTTELPVYFFITGIFISFPVLLFSIYLTMISSTVTISNLMLLIGILLSFLSMCIGFVFLFMYLRKIFMGLLGADVYAIWQEV